MKRLPKEALTQRHKTSWAAWENFRRQDRVLRDAILEDPSDEFMVPVSASLASYFLLRRLRFSQMEAAELFGLLAGRPFAQVVALMSEIAGESREVQVERMREFGRENAVGS